MGRMRTPRQPGAHLCDNPVATAAEILTSLQARPDSAAVRRKTYLPRPADWIHAIRNKFVLKRVFTGSPGEPELGLV